MADDGALDVPTTDVAELIKPAPDSYVEDAGFRPDPHYQYGNLDTSDTSGGAHQKIEEITPLFRAAKAQNLITAAQALDPDHDTPAELVTLPPHDKSVEEARAEIAGALTDLAENPILLGGRTPEQEKAALENPNADANEEGTRSASVQGGGEPAAKGTSMAEDSARTKATRARQSSS